MRQRVTPTQARGQLTRSRLLMAARTVFEERGYSGTRLTDITESAETAIGSFYRYFDSKRSILIAVAESVRDELLDHQRVAFDRSLPPLERTRRAWEVMIAANRRCARVLAVLDQLAVGDDEIRRLRLSISRTLAHTTERAITLHVAEGVADPEIDPAYLALAFRALADRWAFTWEVLDEDYDPQRSLDVLIDIYVRSTGLRAHLAASSGDAIATGGS